MTAPDPVIDTARTAHRNGFAVVPPREDGTKRPIGSWKQYQTNRPTDRELSAWYKAGNCRGVGIITGTVSGGAELLELEGRAMDAGLWEQLWNLAREEGHAELLDRVAGGYTEDTPSGGVHLLYRVEGGDVPGNEKLARSASGDVLIETRGEGGYVITAPSNGGVHPSGDAWVIVSGGFDQVATITRRERDTLHNLARRLDQYAQADTPPEPGGFVITPTGDDPTPWDRFNATTTAHDVLTRAGFVLHSESPDTRRGGTATHYTRPGKSKADGSSVTVWADGRTTIFSSSVPVPGEVDDRRRLSPWQLHTHLNHGGDFEGAARLERIGTPATSGVTVSERPNLPQPIVWHDFWEREHSQAWLCEPILPAGRLVAIYAQGKAGKSLLTLEMAAAIATGRPFLHQEASAPVNVVYIDAEMTEADLQARLLDMGYGPNDDLARLHYYLLPTLPPLDKPEGGDALLEIAHRHQAQAVVIDTVSRVISGAENDADTFLALYRNTSMRLKAAEIALLRLDHTGKDATRGQRGSSAKAQDVDLAWNLTATPGVGYTRVTLKLTESRLAHIANRVELNRYQEPTLHHALPPGTVMGISDAAVKVLRMLDAEGVPQDAGRPTALDALRASDQGYVFSTTALIEALRWRRTHPGNGEVSAQVTPPNREEGQA